MIASYEGTDFTELVDCFPNLRKFPEKTVFASSKFENEDKKIGLQLRIIIKIE